MSTAAKEAHARAAAAAPSASTDAEESNARDAVPLYVEPLQRKFSTSLDKLELLPKANSFIKTAPPTNRNEIATSLVVSFPPHGRFQGTITKYDPRSDNYAIVYDDGDDEVVSYDPILSYDFISNHSSRPGHRRRQVKSADATIERRTQAQCKFGAVSLMLLLPCSAVWRSRIVPTARLTLGLVVFCTE